MLLLEVVLVVGTIGSGGPRVREKRDHRSARACLFMLIIIQHQALFSLHTCGDDHLSFSLTQYSASFFPSLLHTWGTLALFFDPFMCHLVVPLSIVSVLCCCLSHTYTSRQVSFRVLSNHQLTAYVLISCTTN